MIGVELLLSEDERNVCVGAFHELLLGEGWSRRIERELGASEVACRQLCESARTWQAGAVVTLTVEELQLLARTVRACPDIVEHWEYPTRAGYSVAEALTVADRLDSVLGQSKRIEEGTAGEPSST